VPEGQVLGSIYIRRHLLEVIQELRFYYRETVERKSGGAGLKSGARGWVPSASTMWFSSLLRGFEDSLRLGGIQPCSLSSFRWCCCLNVAFGLWQHQTTSLLRRNCLRGGPASNHLEVTEETHYLASPSCSAWCEPIADERENLGRNLEEIEYRVKDATDLKAQFNRNTGWILGAAVAGGFLLSLAVGRSSKSRTIGQSGVTERSVTIPSVSTGFVSTHLNRVSETIDDIFAGS